MHLKDPESVTYDRGKPSLICFCYNESRQKVIEDILWLVLKVQELIYPVELGDDLIMMLRGSSVFYLDFFSQTEISDGGDRSKRYSNHIRNPFFSEEYL